MEFFIWVQVLFLLRVLVADCLDQPRQLEGLRFSIFLLLFLSHFGRKTHVFAHHLVGVLGRYPPHRVLLVDLLDNQETVLFVVAVFEWQRLGQGWGSLVRLLQAVR